MFLYSTVSTLNPMVGMVVTISPSLSLYKIVVLPAASRPTIRIRISFLAKSRLNSFVKVSPISASPDDKLRVKRFRSIVMKIERSTGQEEEIDGDRRLS
uniref:Putative adp-ribosylation factor 2 n=1 Tax=Rhizophora mucronata TaxID=61149 RepID=A0A2P2LC44_RHIMU